MNLALPHMLVRLLAIYHRPSAQQYKLMKSFSLLLLGMFLSSLATLNFSLAFLVGLLATPLTFADGSAHAAVRWAWTVALNLVAPTMVLIVSSLVWDLDVGEVLRVAAFGWDVWGMYTPVVVWCVWWPAWLVGAILVLAKPAPKAKTA